MKDEAGQQEQEMEDLVEDLGNTDGFGSFVSEFDRFVPFVPSCQDFNQEIRSFK